MHTRARVKNNSYFNHSTMMAIICWKINKSIKRIQRKKKLSIIDTKNHSSSTLLKKFDARWWSGAVWDVLNRKRRKSTEMEMKSKVIEDKQTSQTWRLRDIEWGRKKVSSFFSYPVAFLFFFLRTSSSTTTDNFIQRSKLNLCLSSYCQYRHVPIFV